MANINTNLVSFAYDNPTYVARKSVEFPVTAAGAGAVTTKYVAWSNMVAFGVMQYSAAIGSSTYTFSSNGTQTVGILATQQSLIVITNTAAYGVTVGLATSTYGPFTAAGSYVVSGTATNQVGQSTYFAINGTANGGVLIPKGSEYYFVSGTDATATTITTLEYTVQFSNPSAA